VLPNQLDSSLQQLTKGGRKQEKEGAVVFDGREEMDQTGER